MKDFNNTGRVYGGEETPEQEGLRKLLTTGVVFLLGLGVVCGVVGGCSGSANQQTSTGQMYEEAKNLAAVKNEKLKQANILAEKIFYFKDARTELCFAYFWENRSSHGSYDQGGPALAQVPCGSVPADMLVATTVPPPR